MIVLRERSDDHRQWRRVIRTSGGQHTGADVIYGATNPPYHQWRELFPPTQKALLAAAEQNDAAYVAIENVYAYGHLMARH